jgi:signal transduction histidine kinase/ABC-type phosphate/phosphonate transport system substrate-binding protein/CheY-like chemotaxis protein
LRFLNKQFFIFFFLFFFFSISPLYAFKEGQSKDTHFYTFGILAKRGEEIEKNRFYKLKLYLEKKLPYKIKFEFLPFEELKTKALSGKLNFILTNPYQAITIKELALKKTPPKSYRIILSLGQLEDGGYYPFFGGVIFTRKDSSINSLLDIKGQTFGAVNPDSLGGYLIALYELYKKGIYEKDIKPKFYGTHNEVVRAVLRGEISVGTVRTGILERMAKTGEISLKDFKILNQKFYPQFPLIISSDLYPEWPVLALEGTQEEVIKSLAQALLAIPNDSEIAKSIEGIFYLPFDYSPINQILFELMKGPYVELREAYFKRFKEKYLPYVMALLIVFIMFLSLLAYIFYQRNRLLSLTKAELEKEKAFLDTVLRHTDFMVFFLDKEGRPIWANQKGERICLDDGKPEAIWNLCPTLERISTFREFYERAITSDEPINFVETIEEEDMEKTYEGELISIKKGKEIKGIIFFLRDITEKVIMEKQKLYLEKLNVLKNIAGGLAHDFNNKLLAVMNQLELIKTKLKKRRLPREVENLFVDLQNSLLNMKILGRELLTLVRGEAPQKEKANIIDFVKDYTALTLAGKENYEVFYEIEAPIPLVEIDKELFSIMWINLMLNAVEAMPKGGKITIGIKPYFQNHQKWVELSIKDEGQGISSKYLDKIFDPFFTTKPGGSGLGLYIVKEVVKAHNGEIKLETEEGKGTTFKIFLPALEKEILITKPEKEKGEKRLLLMDDDDLIRNTLKELLEHFDYKVETAPDGETALKIFTQALMENHSFDYVILNLIVPGKLNGFETYQKMKALDPNLKAILISGYFEEPIMLNYKEFGLKGALIKPFTIQQLLDLLQD